MKKFAFVFNIRDLELEIWVFLLKKATLSATKNSTFHSRPSKPWQFLMTCTQTIDIRIAAHSFPQPNYAVILSARGHLISVEQFLRDDDDDDDKLRDSRQFVLFNSKIIVVIIFISQWSHFHVHRRDDCVVCMPPVKHKHVDSTTISILSSSRLCAHFYKI